MTALREACDLIQAGDLAGADALLETAKGQCASWQWLTVKAGSRMRARDFGAALDALGEAEALNPQDFTIPYNAGLCHYERGAFRDACAAYARAIFRNPTFAKAWLKLGGSHLPLAEFAEGLACQERAVSMDTDDAELRIGLGTTISLFGDDAGAEAQYRKALELNPAAFEAEIALGFVLLRSGQWEEGWRCFEARANLRPFGAPWDWKPAPFWSGRPKDLEGKRVLLRAEQGFGDTVQFARYVPLVAKRAAEVRVECPPSLRRLLGTLGVSCDAHCWDRDIEISLMSLPRIFRTLPCRVPDPAGYKVEAKPSGARVGLCWHGGARVHDGLANADDRRRSIAWEEFLPIADVVPCVSLQEEDLPPGGDWLDTAAIIKGLYLVITVDTAVAHLSASMGVPTWLLARAGGCWRWGSSGDRTPWYPAMRIYRQETLMDWRPVVSRVAADLKKWSKG